MLIWTILACLSLSKPTLSWMAWSHCFGPTSWKPWMARSLPISNTRTALWTTLPSSSRTILSMSQSLNLWTILWNSTYAQIKLALDSLPIGSLTKSSSCKRTAMLPRSFMMLHLLWMLSCIGSLAKRMSAWESLLRLPRFNLKPSQWIWQFMQIILLRLHSHLRPFSKKS